MSHPENESPARPADRPKQPSLAVGMTLLVLAGYHCLRWLSKAAGTYQPALLDGGLTEYDEEERPRE